MKLTICHLYGAGMNIYGDRGNVITLLQRCRWRGIEAEVVRREVGETSGFDGLDLIFAGGGQDREQIAVSEDLQGEAGRSLRNAIEDNIVMLAICGTYQLLGRYFKTGDGTILPGLGALDLTTEAGSRRFIGDIVVRPSVGDLTDPLIGFENHSGRTFLGPGARPLGEVLIGNGNNGEDRTEGAVYRNVFGTYLHGSLLPKNPRFADLLIAIALRRRYGPSVELPALPDSLEQHTRAAVLAHIRQRGRIQSGVI